MRRQKHFFWTLCCWIDVLSVQSKNNISENYIQWRIKNRKFQKKLRFLSFFSQILPQKHPNPALGTKKKVLTPHDYYN